ncbi:hypothetical protein F2P81_010398 [Scophthalmus maximus]|uniref:AIG1-type G domain-containing protein n=1 Tax=Scophthalmus maximus TaxID=52904 RepID=A0A6A4T2T4_SCOMX|nr:hypothetical protein F2P81_010398 [Scophthalmus maximus]
MDVVEAEPDVEAHGTKRPHKEPKGFVSEMTQQSGYCGTEPELCGVDFLPAYPVCVRGGEEEANPSSVLEYSFYLDDQHGTVMGPVSPPDTTMIQRPCPFIPLPSPVTTIATAIDLNSAVSSPMTDSCSPICSMCNPTASDRDTLRSTSTSPGCSDRDPVCAAAHLHLLGESLSLIGHHLQQTDKNMAVFIIEPKENGVRVQQLVSALGLSAVCPGSDNLPHRTDTGAQELHTTHAAMSEHPRGSSYHGSSTPELRLVLLGNLGCGKTSSADTILGQLSRVSPAAARSCQQRQNIIEGRSVTLVEAPRWYWSGGRMEDSVRKETERAMTLVAPGPHAILLLVPVCQFTEMEGCVPAELEEVFGAESLDHTLVLLTCGDYLMGKTVEEYLQKEHPGLRQIIERCGGRHHVFNNRRRQDREQVLELLEKVDNMVQQNGVYHRKTVQERELEKRVTERRRELMESYRSQKEERKEVALTRTTNTETQRSVNRGEEFSSTVERATRPVRDEMEGRVGSSLGSNGLHSTPAPERQSYSSQLHDDRQVAVVDTPDWFNSERAPEEVRAQISSCVALSSPGPHAFLLCVPLDQPAKTELQALRALETVFGPEAVQRHALVLFTYADRLRASGKAGNESVEAYIAGQRGDLLNLVEKCRDRFHVMESGGGETERRSVAELLEKVEQTVKEAGGQCYSSPAFQEAENRVRQRQVEIAREKRGTNQEQAKSRDVGGLSTERQLYPYMQPVAEAEEEVREDEIGETRDEAEMSVSTMDIESLPPITLSSLSPSLLSSVMEKMQSSAKLIPKLLTDGSVWVGDGAKKVKGSPVWGTVGSRAQNVQKMVVDSSVWGKMGASAKQASKLLGDRVPKVVVDSSSWVGSGAKAAAASPMWGKVGSGARTGAKNLTQSPMWAKVGSGAKTGAQLVAQNSVRVGAGIGAGAKKVAQSPVWEKVGSGAKSGAKMVAASPVWEKIGTTAKQVPMVVIAGAVLGLLLGLLLGGAIGGAVGAAAGSAVTEVGRRKLGNKSTLGKTEDAAKTLERRVNDSVDSIVKQGGKVLKTE